MTRWHRNKEGEYVDDTGRYVIWAYRTYYLHPSGDVYWYVYVDDEPIDEDENEFRRLDDAKRYAERLMTGQREP